MTSKKSKPERGNASKPVSFKPLTPSEAMTALLSVSPEDLDDALKSEGEHPDQSDGHN